MTPLCELAKKFRTDKVRHGYTRIYYENFKDRAESITRVLEVGIARGGSLYMWAKFFPQAMIFGMDKNINCLFDDGRIRSLYGNQSKPEKLAMIMKRTFEGNKFDIIIDDGSHKPDRQIKTLSVLLSYLRDSGLYFVEDVRGDEYVDLVRNALPDMFDSRVYRSVKPDSNESMVMIWKSRM